MRDLHRSAVAALLDATLERSTPADRLVADLFRAHRSLANADRLAIVELYYHALSAAPRLLELLSRARLAYGGEALLAALDTLEPGRAPMPDTRGGVRRALRVAALEPAPRWARLAIPQWLEPWLEDAFGDALEAEAAALNAPAPIDLRVNTLACTLEAARERLAEEGVESTPITLCPLGLRLARRVAVHRSDTFRDGWIERQDAGSQRVAAFVGAAPGLRVIDLCAGAGGKTLALAAAMANRGLLIACDVDDGKLAEARRRFKRAGVGNTQTRHIAASGDKWLKRQARAADLVLADAPCSGSGTWRRAPDLKLRFTPDALKRLVGVQREILARAATLVKPGGALVYATCSVLPVENDGQAAWFEATHGAEWTREDTLRLTPYRDHTDGFYAVRWRRAAAA